MRAGVIKTAGKDPAKKGKRKISPAIEKKKVKLATHRR
jgi:hypothetical protein